MRPLRNWPLCKEGETDGKILCHAHQRGRIKLEDVPPRRREAVKKELDK